MPEAKIEFFDNMAVELIRRGLPKLWTLAVTRDGRIFFINDYTRSTTWLHPVTGEPVSTGHGTSTKLPSRFAWERGVTPQGIPFYIDHSKQETTFVHPVTQESAVRAEAIQSPPLRPLFPRVEAQPKAIISSTPTMELKKPQHQRKKSSGSIRSPLVKRDHQTQVILKGWLYRLEGGALKQWKKRWVVLADFCLFYYKNDGEDRLLGSILLPSYTINVCCSNDHISRRFAFKAEHQNMKTYYFAADSKESCIKWMNAMSLASIMQKDLYPFSSGYPPTDQHRRSSPAVMHDEEDSGFTSYRSRRGRNHDPNSTLNSSFGSSRGPHSSVGSNGYLGSDEKYPLQYLECPRKPGGQPLYANAPPKPKRVGPKDAYQCTSPYDNYDPSAVQPDHYRVPQTLYAVPNPHEEDPNWPAGINYQDNFVYGSGYYPMAERKDRMFASKSQQQQQPQRPHSAEFLDRETYDGGGDIPIESHRPRTPRQRPKSSLEQYDPQQYYWGSHSDTAPQRSPSYLNAQSAYEWSSPDRRMHPELVYQMRLRQQQEVRSLSRPEMSGFVDPEQKKAQLREESLKRLLEWKQRMLQSPLSRKSGSPQHQQQRRHSDLPPARPPLPEEYRQKVLRDLENHEARLRMYETQFRSQVYDEENVPPPAPTAATQNVRHDDAPTVYRERSRSASGKREVVEIVRNGWPPQHPMHSASNAQEQRKSSKSLNFLNNSYSSDDETCSPDRRRIHPPIQAVRSRKGGSDPSPDYVNLNALLQQQKPPHHSQQQHQQSEASHAWETDTREGFYIGREDYYRASQLFYPPRQKQEDTFEGSQQRNTASTKWDMDKDVGLSVLQFGLPSGELRVRKRSHSCPREGGRRSDGEDDSVFKDEGDLEDTNHRRRLSLRDRARRDFLESQKHSPILMRSNCSLEEMRGALQRRREAPPPNLVQQRIKLFEAQSSEDVRNSPPNVVTDQPKTSLADHVVSPNDEPLPMMRKQTLHSDSEALLPDRVTSDDETIRSAPLILSPLSSVLADLRRTADTKKDKGLPGRGGLVDEVIITKGALRLSMAESQEGEVVLKRTEKVEDAYEVEYLPMSGVRPVEEAVYVVMSSAGEGEPQQKEEPLYNEPASPPPTSFLHDVFRKKRRSTTATAEDTSSSNEDSEKVYEKPKLRLEKSIEELRPSKAFHESYTTGESRKSGASPRKSPKTVRDDPGIPDLLHHDGKDSDASDADDEASRDFDSPNNLSMPSYQKEVLYNDDAPRLAGSQESAKKRIRVYEDERRFTEFIFNKGTSEKAKEMQQVRIYSEEGCLRDSGVKLVGPGPPAHTKSSSDQQSAVPMSSQAAPDVIPPETEKGARAQRSPNSAPYYYSDLLPDGSDRLLAMQTEFLPLSPRSSRAMLNNVRDITIPGKGDVGRKVNKIHDSAANPASDFSEELSQAVARELRHSLEHLLGRERKKFQDMERNQYEAGHTLEKTRQSSAFSKMKHRSTTPDFDRFYPRGSSEHEYENIGDLSCVVQGTLTKRLSRSLEGLLDSAPSQHEVKDGSVSASEEPYYENIDFIRLQHRMSPDSITKERDLVASPQTQPAKHSVRDPSQMLHFDSLTRHPRSRPGSAMGPRIVSHQAQDQDSDSGYENILRRESKRHFLGRSEGLTPSAPKNNRSGHLFLGGGQKSDFDGGGVEADVLSSDSSDTPELEGSVQDWKSRKHVLRKKTLQARDGINVSDSEIHKQTSVKVRRLIQKSHGLSRHGKRLSISAGDLLEKSHEELVLLLIQLRRSQARMLKTKERCRVQLESMQKITKMDAAATEQVQTYEELRTQMEELDKQQKYTSPLINLVDNMVKLGSLYRGSDKRSLSEPTLDMNRLEPYSPSQSMLDFTNQLQKQLIAHQDSKDDDFKERIERLYELNVILQEESANLAALHQDKDMLEMTLDSVRCKISDVHDNSLTIQKLQKQQQMLERELGRVRNLLAQSAQRMEETAAENAKLEQDILMLREKIQQALRITGSPGKDTSAQVRADLEMELSKVQNVIEDLARRRHELSNAVETLRSESRYRSAVAHVRASPTGVAGSAPLPIRRRQLSTYLETDLDSLDSRDLASVPRHIYFTDEESPLYVNATDITPDEETADTSTDDVLEPALLTSELQAQVLAELYLPQDINEADERMKKFYGILPRDKPAEIKTVRIVKRESERRNKGRTEKKRVTYDDQSLVWLVEEPDFCLSDDKEDEEEYDERDTEGNQSLDSSLYKRPTTLLFPGGHYQQHVYPSAHEQLFGLASAHVMSPSSSSSSNQKSPNDYRSPFKKAKRRHYTISGSQPYTEQIYTKSGPRSRDDMDMERCLRTVNTPDIVRSTIKKTDVFDDKIIDRELGTPQKILIPERYIEDEPETLSVQEQLQRSLKAENIRKMLSETTTYGDIGDKSHKDLLQKKLNEEKRKRAHLLALNHALAKEVMERSKMVAANLSSLDPPPNSP